MNSNEEAIQDLKDKKVIPKLNNLQCQHLNHLLGLNKDCHSKLKYK